MAVGQAARVLSACPPARWGSIAPPCQEALFLQFICLDLEGVLVPEIWIAFAERTGIAEFRRTTRDEPDYDKLMRWRLDLLREHGLKLADIQARISFQICFSHCNDCCITMRACPLGSLCATEPHQRDQYPDDLSHVLQISRPAGTKQERVTSLART